MGWHAAAPAVASRQATQPPVIRRNWRKFLLKMVDCF